MANTINYSLEISKFELQLHYYVHFQTNAFEKGITPHICQIVSLLFNYKDNFGIE